MREKADSDLVRRQNRLLLLEALRQQGGMARVEMGRHTGLSPASITTISSQLIADGILKEASAAHAAAEGPQRRGRPATLIDFNPKAANVVAVRVSIDGLELALADARGSVLARRASRTATYDANPAAFGKVVAGEIATLLAKTRVPAKRVARAGIAVQGVADSQAGAVVWSPAFRGRNISVASAVEDRLGIPCRVANDANMIAEGLTGIDRARYGGTAAVVFMGWGVGMGLIINGQVYHGPTGAAAEFGHMNHLPDGPLCRCGRRGCVEAYVADYSLLRWASGHAATQPPSSNAIPAQDMLALETAAHRGDPNAVSAYAKAGEALGFGLARLIVILTPSRIVLAGPGTRAMPLIRPHLDRALEQGVVDELRRTVEIEVVPIGTDMIIKGTIDRALRHVDREIFAHGPLTKRVRELETVA
ncbi:ROK family transcriptional regulator [Aestuariivirga sp.]|uniref:ROK family transcriptional regulator n=1 Tax=Aestuariivirga sp. TaxID=2650926 RepID=UPI0025C5DC1C|nr:ROK family transcriptional regulator [Aestuariivirga sp.]MCA3555376.1 ROK family transcriptional regulator [Aestuariivirga sp.]